MRTIDEIKKEMVSKYLSHDAIKAAYGITGDVNPDSYFSSVSLENVIFYVVALSTWAFENLFLAHKSEMQEMIANQKSGTLKWLCNKAKLFMAGYELAADSDVYDYSDMTDEQIAAAQCVKHAAAVENNGIVYLKVAGDDNGAPAQITNDEVAGLAAYINEVKYAGVAIELINLPADHYRMRMVVYYNPMILNSTGGALLGGDPVRDAIRDFLRSLPFNSEYRNVDLVDALQKVSGVVIPELLQAEVSPNGLEGTWRTVEAIALPDSGYYKIYDDSEMNLEFRPYEGVSN